MIVSGKNTLFVILCYLYWIWILTLKSLQSWNQFNFISFHVQDYEQNSKYSKFSMLTQGCSDDHGCMSRILSYLVFAWSTAINCDQPRSTWAIWRRNPLWSARVAPCMWTRREFGIERGRWGMRIIKDFKLQISRTLSVDHNHENEEWELLRETVCSLMWWLQRISTGKIFQNKVQKRFCCED